MVSFKLRNRRQALPPQNYACNYTFSLFKHRDLRYRGKRVSTLQSLGTARVGFNFHTFHSLHPDQLDKTSSFSDSCSHQFCFYIWPLSAVISHVFFNSGSEWPPGCYTNTTLHLVSVFRFHTAGLRIYFGVIYFDNPRTSSSANVQKLPQ
jgi:hypothetical protein